MSFERKEPDEVIHPYSNKSFQFSHIILVIILTLVILFILLIVYGSIYTIEPNEVGVVLRFGKFTNITNPGLHFKLPLGVEKVFPVKVEYIYKEEFGFRTHLAAIRTEYESRTYDNESLMLSGDLNVLDLEWIVQFKINDPVKFLFKVRDVKKTLRDISESVMRKVVGDYTFNDVLTTKRIEIDRRVQDELQKILDFYNLGIQIVTVKMQDVNPPDPVKSAFNEVNEAKQEKEKLINQAWEVYNREIPQAKGEALKMIMEAEGYALEKINIAKGDAKRFVFLMHSYQEAKNVTLKRLYLETMADVLKKAGKKYITDTDEKGIIQLLNLKNDK